jgi:hypothetical protein
VTPPETTLTATPPAAFAFVASETGATFACSLDGSAFAACTSPESYGGLAVGPHSFQVRATDALGNVDPTPASYAWTVVPANDAFAAATVLSGADGQVGGTTLYATKELGEPAHAGNPGGHSVWYRWTSPCRCTITFKTLGSSFDTVLAAYTGASVSVLKLVAANDDSPSGHDDQPRPLQGAARDDVLARRRREGRRLRADRPRLAAHLANSQRFHSVRLPWSQGRLVSWGHDQERAQPAADRVGDAGPRRRGDRRDRPLRRRRGAPHARGARPGGHAGDRLRGRGRGRRLLHAEPSTSSPSQTFQAPVATSAGS